MGCILIGMYVQAMAALGFEYSCKGTRHFFKPAESMGGPTFVFHLVS